MRTLLLVQDFGPSEAMVLSSLRSAGDKVSVYDVRGRWIVNGIATPFWLQGYRLGSSSLAAGYMEQFIREFDVRRVIASGLEACSFASATIAEEFTPLLWRTDLDFSARRESKVQAFDRLVASTDRLLLEDEWEMDKAGAKGSRSAHLRIPAPGQARIPVLEPAGARARVAILHPSGMTEERLAAMTHSFERSVPEADFAALQIESLYRWRDAGRQRDFRSTMSTRLRGYSHVVLVGTSRHHTVVLDALRGDWDRVALEETIGGGNLARALGFDQVGRGTHLTSLVGDLVREQHGSPGQETRKGEANDFAERLQAAMNQPVASTVEELAVLDSNGPLNVFFSAAPLQDRTNGARPQRIRNMAEAFDIPEPAIRLFSSGPGFNRRLETIRAELRRGRPAGVFYGENSTTPIESVDTIDELGRFLDEFGSAGGRSAWFVRDLHWLDEVDGYLDQQELRDEVTRRGLYELETVGDRCDVLLAPCAASAEGFNMLLERSGVGARAWEALPPAIAPQNVSSPVGEDTEDDRVTLLYAGGSNSVYGMDAFLGSFERLESEHYVLDFVVRREEIEFLLDSLRRHGLENDDRVRILHTELENYHPRTGRCFGTILLDSEYARFSFPYKTVSMIERGFPVVAFDDMAIAEFVESTGTGAVSRRDADSLTATLERMRSTDFTSDIAAAQVSQTWSARVEKLRTLLEVEEPVH